MLRHEREPHSAGAHQVVGPGAAQGCGPGGVARVRRRRARGVQGVVLEDCRHPSGGLRQAQGGRCADVFKDAAGRCGRCVENKAELVPGPVAGRPAVKPPQRDIGLAALENRPDDPVGQHEIRVPRRRFPLRPLHAKPQVPPITAGRKLGGADGGLHREAHGGAARSRHQQNDHPQAQRPGPPQHLPHVSGSPVHSTRPGSLSPAGSARCRPAPRPCPPLWMSSAGARPNPSSRNDRRAPPWRTGRQRKR